MAEKEAVKRYNPLWSFYGLRYGDKFVFWRLHNKDGAGFTLIELLVVIAILGVLVVVLLTIIDPVDKIRSANDVAVINTVSQLGKANDSYALNHSNFYVGGNFTDAVDDLNRNGEVKNATIPPPAGYTYGYRPSPFGCATDACTGYVFYVNLRSKKHLTASPIKLFYMYANGRNCYSATAPIAGSTCP